MTRKKVLIIVVGDKTFDKVLGFEWSNNIKLYRF